MAYRATDGTILQTIEEARAYSRNNGQGFQEIQDTVVPDATTQDDGIPPFVQGVPFDSFLQGQLEENVAFAITQLEENFAIANSALTADYQRFVSLTKEDRAKTILDTNKAFARAKERAVVGYSDRNLGDSGIKREGIQDFIEAEEEDIGTIERSAERDLSGAKISFEREKEEQARRLSRGRLAEQRRLSSPANTAVVAQA